MAWVAVDKDGEEYIFADKPKLEDGVWMPAGWKGLDSTVKLPDGSIEKLTGSPMSWEDSPREVK